MQNSMTNMTSGLNLFGAMLDTSEQKAASLSQATLSNFLGWEQFTTRRERLYDSMSEQIRAHEARQKLFHFLECEKSLQEGVQKHTQRQDQLMIMMRLFSTPLSRMTACGRFVLIDQLLTKLAKKRSMKEIRLVKTLINAEAKDSVLLHPPLSIEPQVFVENMISNAENTSYISGAEQLNMAFENMHRALFQAIHRSFPYQEGRIGGRQMLSIWNELVHDEELKKLYRHLDEKWNQFTGLYLKSRLFELADMRVLV